jgi:DNA-binding NarL/FixJ family response regulator
MRIMIADNHPIFLSGLRMSLESEPGLSVIGESSVGPEVVKLARELQPDVLLLDLALPGRSGLEVLARVAGPPLSIRTLVLVAEVEKAPILEALYFGAHGVVSKGAQRPELLRSVRAVMAGQYWLGQESVPIVIAALRESAPPRDGAAAPKDYGLTARELEIVTRIAAGSSNKDVSREIFIGERTVKQHLTNIFEKLGVSNRLELAVFALDHGLVRRPGPSKQSERKSETGAKSGESTLLLMASGG